MACLNRGQVDQSGPIGDNRVIRNNWGNPILSDPIFSIEGTLTCKILADTSSDLQIRQKRANPRATGLAVLPPRQQRLLHPSVAYIFRNGTLIGEGRVKGPYTIEVNAQIVLRYRKRISIAVQDPIQERLQIVRIRRYTVNPFPIHGNRLEATADLELIDRIPGRFADDDEGGTSRVHP